MPHLTAVAAAWYTVSCMPERLYQSRFDEQFRPTFPLDVTPECFAGLESAKGQDLRSFEPRGGEIVRSPGYQGPSRSTMEVQSSRHLDGETGMSSCSNLFILTRRSIPVSTSPIPDSGRRLDSSEDSGALRSKSSTYASDPEEVRGWVHSVACPWLR